MDLERQRGRSTRNLTQIEAAERSRLLDVTSYDITLDLTDGTGGPGDGTFRSTTEITFRCREPGATTFIEAAMHALRSATLNGKPLDICGWTAETGLTLTDLAAENTLVVDADALYSTTGQGLHRSLDPVDKEVYLYSQFETADAQRVFACFDQPDLKSVYTWHVTVPAHWTVVSNSPVAAPIDGDVDGHQDPALRAVGADVDVHHRALRRARTTRSARRTTASTWACSCRQSMKQYLDADDIFLITEQGFDFFHEQFGVRYPLPKYDQLYVPEFNAGAMENFGCVVHGEEYYIFRSAVTDYEYENRANTILHEMAHMWFGDLVTMRWWDDLWLNESFAEWASHWANAQRDPVRRRVDDVPVGAQELGLPPGPAVLDPPGLLRHAGHGGGRGQLRRHHVRQGRERHQAAGRVRRDRRVRGRPAGLLRASTPGATPPSATC